MTRLCCGQTMVEISIWQIIKESTKITNTYVDKKCANLVF
jgi:hypothetical protein